MSDRPLLPILISPRDEPLVCLEINEAWIPFLIGIVHPYQYPEKWSGTLAENRLARQYSKVLLDILMESIGCDDMSNCCYIVEHTTIILHQVNPITLALEISVDNGQTWIPDPNSIPYQLTEQVPPVTSGMSASKCDAASNGKQHLEDWIAGVSIAFDHAATVFEFGVQVVLVIAGIILWFLSAGALTLQEIAAIEAIAGALHQVFTLGKTAWDNYWTSDERDKLLCALVCNIGEDGSFSDTQFQQVIADMNAKLSAGAQKLLLLAMMGQIGKVGLNNMCSYGASSDADCSGCDCECDFQGWTANLATAIEPVLGSDAFGDYLQWTGMLTDAGDYRVNASNDGNWPSLNYSSNCCVPGNGRFRVLEPGTETVKSISGIFGYRCGDNNLEHFGALTNEAWWGFEAVNSGGGGAFDVRLYWHML